MQKGIKNIIFDLGGVILPIDISRTTDSFKRLGVQNIEELFALGHASSFFKELEQGRINSVEFIDKVKNLVGQPLPDETIIDAWNALILDFPQERIDLLRKLKEKYRLFLFSNTNLIHYRKFQQQIHIQTGCHLEELFEKTYYSHEIGLRKPDIASYQLIINENKLDASQTLFVDDAEVNIAGAKKAGLHGLHIVPGTSIMEIEW